MFPLKDNIPLARLPARHDRAGRHQRRRLPAGDPPRRQLLRRSHRRRRGPLRGHPLRAHAPGQALRTGHVQSPEGLLCDRRLPGPARRQRHPRSTARHVADRLQRRCSCTAASCTSSATCCSSAIFGPTVEDRMGRLRFPVFYLLGGLVALAQPGGRRPQLHRPHARRLRRDRRRARRLHPAVSPRPHPQPRIHRVLRHHRRGPRRVPARLLVPRAALLRPRPASQVRWGAEKASPTSPTSAASPSACW